MMNTYMVLVTCSLLFVSVSQAMWSKDKDKKHFEPDHKSKIQNCDSDIEKLKKEQQQYRSKHKALKDEPTDVRLGVDEKK
jgi:hypothetical protein